MLSRFLEGIRLQQQKKRQLEGLKGQGGQIPIKGQGAAESCRLRRQHGLIIPITGGTFSIRGNMIVLRPHLASQMGSLSCRGGCPRSSGSALCPPSQPRPGPSGLHLAAPWPSRWHISGRRGGEREVRVTATAPGSSPDGGPRGSAPAWAPAGARLGVTSRSPPPRPRPTPTSRVGPGGVLQGLARRIPLPWGRPLPSGRASAPRVSARRPAPPARGRSRGARRRCRH